jgi:hypothetical protein
MTMHRPLILNPAGHAEIERLAAKRPEGKRDRYRAAVRQRLTGEPSRLAVETVSYLVFQEMQRGEQIAMIGGRAS